MSETFESNIVLDRNGFDYRRGFGALRRGVRQQILQLITAAEARGSTTSGLGEPSSPAQPGHIITTLNDPEPGKANHAGRQQHSPHPCWPAAA